MADPADAERREEKRRELQRRKQREARERQAKGALTKKELKAKRRASRGDAAAKSAAAKSEKTKQAGAKRKSAESPGKSWREREFQGKGRSDFKKARKAATASMLAEAEGRRKHDLVVLPIFWRQNPGEEEAVVAEAERIKAMLSEFCDVWIDRTHKKSPGQKFAFWEAVGVRHRVELGPADVKAQRCVVVASGGGYAAARRLTVCSVDRFELVNALKTDLGLDKLPRIDDDGDVTQKQMTLAAENRRRWKEQAALPRADDTTAAATAKAGPGKIDLRHKSSNLKRLDGAADAETPLPPVRNDDELVDQWAPADAEDDDDDDD